MLPNYIILYDISRKIKWEKAFEWRKSAGEIVHLKMFYWAQISFGKITRNFLNFRVFFVMEQIRRVQ